MFLLGYVYKPLKTSMGNKKRQAFPLNILSTKKKGNCNFPGGPVVKRLLSDAGGFSLIPSQGTKILSPAGHESSNIVTNIIKTLRNSIHQNKPLERLN